jgi:hypothetical protein
VSAIWVLPWAVAARFWGTLGGVVSGGSVVASAGAERAERLPAASTASTV